MGNKVGSENQKSNQKSKTPISNTKETKKVVHSKSNNKSHYVYDALEGERKNQFILESFKNTGVSFNERELTNLKLKTNDAEKYFGTKFDYFVCFNSYLFQERINQIYDNYNAKVESCKKGKLKILIEFDDETDMSSQGNKIEFDSLFTVILEKMEIEILIYFDLTNVDLNYMSNFFEQLIESIDMYKYNRKYDSLFFLLPNTDYIMKYDSCLVYYTYKNYDLINELDRMLGITCESSKHFEKKTSGLEIVECLEEKVENENENENGSKKKSAYSTIDFRNKFIEIVFAKFKKENLISCKYPRQIVDYKKQAHETLIDYCKPTYSKINARFTICLNKTNEYKKNHIYSKSINVKDLNLKSGSNSVRNDKRPNLSFFNYENILQTKETNNDALLEMFHEMNLEGINTVNYLIDRVPIINLVMDNFYEINCKAETQIIFFLISNLFDLANDSDLTTTYFHIKIVFNHSSKLILENHGKHSSNFLELVAMQDEISKFITKMNKKKNRVFVYEIIEISPFQVEAKEEQGIEEEKEKEKVNDEKQNQTEQKTEVKEEENKEASKPPKKKEKTYSTGNLKKENLVIDPNRFNVRNERFIYKWKERKTFNAAFLLANLAKKLNKTELLEEEIIQKMNSFISIMYTTTKSSKEVVASKDEYLKLIY